jgi:hypothetical protein
MTLPVATSLARTPWQRSLKKMPSKTLQGLAVPGGDADQLIATLAAVHKLAEMAQRPDTLSLIVDVLPDLERLRAAGKPV